MALRIFSARNRSFVAVAEDEPDVPIGHMQCTRLGDDEGAREVEREKGTWWGRVAEVVYGAWIKVVGLVKPDRSRSLEAVNEFARLAQEEDRIHWEGREERKNRWYVQSVVVSEEWRGRGVGKAMMKEVIERARKQGVVIGLEASPMGEMLYRSVGFELLARFANPWAGEVDNGGIMMWSPK
jgi:GNAT superfamily N-acetyltransferase